MAQIYTPPLGRLTRFLLLQCVIMLGIISTGVAQASLPINYDGPWGGELPQGWSKTGTIISGQDLEGGSQGSAQFRSAGATIEISIANASQTDFRLRYSLQAVTTRSGYSASFTVSYSTNGGSSYTPTESANAITPARTAQRLTDLLPAATTNIRFTLNSVSEAYVLLDAIELVQTPEVLSVTPTSGVPGTAVTITGNRLNNATVKFGEIEVPATLTIKDATGAESTVDGVSINATGTEIVAYVPYGAVANSPITVSTTYGNTAPATFTVPAPVFNANAPFTPAAGIAGTEVTLNGNNFIDTRTVLFNGIEATFTVDHNGKITATVPALASSGPITVTTPSGSANSTSFTVPVPVVSTFTPAVSEGPGTEVIISGEFFNGVTEVKFNGVIATGFTINATNDEITVNVPLGASTGPITVTSPAGTGTSATPFEVPAPKFVARTITEGEEALEFNPIRTGAGKTITIFGENLASVSRVVFAGAEGEGIDGANLVATTDTELTVTVPEGAATGTLQLIAPGDKTATSSQIFEFVPAPSIATVTPIYGEVETEITITGANFQEAESVKIGNGTVLAANFEVSADGTIITLSIPTDATTGTVSVTTPLGGTGVWNGTFDVVFAPTITAFTPAEGPIGQEITLTGTNLKYVTEVVFLGENNTEDESDARVTFTTPNDSETQLVFNVPTGAPASKGKLLVRNSVDAAVSADEFEVILRPVVNTLTPTMGIAGTTVVLEGYNLGNVTVMNFGGEELTLAAGGFTINEAGTQITVAAPADAPVLSDVVVTNEFGSSEAINFTVIKTPTIISFAEERGIVGSEVVITGTNFYGENITVSFAGAEGRVVAPARDVTPTQLKVTVPAGAVTGNLIVTNAAGPSEPTTTDYIVATTPEIFSFTPTTGKVGDDVTITGWLMQSVTYVGFNGTKASVVPSADGRTITVKVPEGATTGRLALYEGENETPVFTTAEGVVFTVIPAPTIVSVNPNSGVGGTVVTITGTNFIDVTSVTFNGVAVATADIAVNETFDVLTVRVPTTATTGNLIVTADAGTATFENFIVPTPAAITFTNNTSTPLESFAYQLVTIRGQYFTNATEVDFNGKKITTGITVVNEVEGETAPDRFQLITVKAPFDAGKGKITVTTPAGSGVSADDYTVKEPKIATISATEGYAAQTVLTITGELFTQYWNETLNDGQGGEDVKAPIVKFNGAQVEATNYAQDGTSITVTVPGSARTGDVTVMSGSGESEPVRFNVLAPVLESVTPAAAYAGQTVTISGTNFINVTSMAYGNIPITGYNIVLTDEEKGTGTITLVAPKINHNTNNTLSVNSTSGTGSTSVFTIYRPVIETVFETGKESLADRRIYAGVNSVTIRGTRFDEFFNGTAVTKADPIVSLVRTGTNGAVTAITGFTLTPSATEDGVDLIVANIPTSVAAGDYLVRVESGSGTGQSSGTVGTITVLGTPTITSLSKVVGLVGETFTITGTFFDDATKVTFLGIEGEADEVDAVFERTSNTTLTVTVPEGATIGKIAVTTPFGGGEGTTVESSQIFRVVKAPIVYDFTPKEGPAGSTVTITGENLIAVDGKIKVTFKGHGGEVIPAPLASQIELNAVVGNEDLIEARSITVTVPTNAITGVISLTNEAGATTTAQARDTEVDVYTVTSPVVVRFEKTNGNIITAGSPARLLETVIVKGYNLVGVQRLRIGSINVFGYYEESEHTLEMIVPRTARTALVTVTTGVGADTSEEMLEIVRPNIVVSPTVLSFKAAVETDGVMEYDVKNYVVTATNLAVGANLEIRLSANTPYLLSLDANSTAEDAWTTSLVLTPDATGNVTQTIYARNNSTTVSNSSLDRYTVFANHTSLEATTATVTLQSEIIPLPVELIAFNATKQGNGVQLTWATASELDNNYFEVQMTEDLKGEFKAVGQVKSKVNTTSLRQDYQFNHKGNFNGTRYYRLKQVDLDGTFEYSKVVAVTSSGVNLAAGPRVYPNPINADSKLVYNADRAGKLNVRVVNMNGSAVQNLSYDIEEGENTILLNLNNNLPTGMYILMTEFNGKTEQVKLLKQ